LAREVEAFWVAGLAGVACIWDEACVEAWPEAFADDGLVEVWDVEAWDEEAWDEEAWGEVWAVAGALFELAAVEDVSAAKTGAAASIAPTTTSLNDV